MDILRLLPNDEYQAAINSPTAATAANPFATVADLTGGSTTFTGLTDTPGSYTGKGGQFVRVNNGETGLEFAATTAETLAATLVAGNTTGGTDIVMSNDDVIIAATGTMQINLRYFTTNELFIGSDPTSFTGVSFYGLEDVLAYGGGLQGTYVAFDNVYMTIQPNAVGTSRFALDTPVQLHQSGANINLISGFTTSNVAIASNNGQFNANVNNTAVVAGDRIDAKADFALYTTELRMQGSLNTFDAIFTTAALTGDQTYTFQDATGTVAFLSDIPALDGNGIYGGNGTIPSATTATITDTVAFTGGSFGVGDTPASRFNVVGTNNLQATIGVRFENASSQDLWTLTNAGRMTMTPKTVDDNKAITITNVAGSVERVNIGVDDSSGYMRLIGFGSESLLVNTSDTNGANGRVAVNGLPLMVSMVDTGLSKGDFVTVGGVGAKSSLINALLDTTETDPTDQESIALAIRQRNATDGNMAVTGYIDSANTLIAENGFVFDHTTPADGMFRWWSGTTSLFNIKQSGAINIVPITAVAASAITPAQGDIVSVSSTDATFTAIGLWHYDGTNWTQL